MGSFAFAAFVVLPIPSEWQLSKLKDKTQNMFSSVPPRTYDVRKHCASELRTEDSTGCVLQLEDEIFCDAEVTSARMKLQSDANPSAPRPCSETR